LNVSAIAINVTIIQAIDRPNLRVVLNRGMESKSQNAKGRCGTDTAVITLATLIVFDEVEKWSF
jgi:hypothetical protein